MSTSVTCYQPRDFSELDVFVQRICRTNMVPKAYQGRPEEAAVAIMFGAEHGIPPLASLQHIAVIQGRPGFFGDAVAGVALKSGAIKAVDERMEGEPGADDWTAICVATRADGGKVERKFSVKDAKRAGLWGKGGPWSQYPQRMLAARARGYAVRDGASASFLGYTAEELRDIDEQPHRGPDNARDVTPQVPANDAVPAIAQEQAEDMIRIYDTDGTTWSVAATIREAVTNYVDLKKARNDKAGLACANIDMLRMARNAAVNSPKLHDSLCKEIEAAEALVDAMDGMHAEPASGADATAAEPMQEAA